MRPELVDTLAASLAKDGLQVPIIVRLEGDTGHCLVAGLHRLEAAKRLGWTEIEASIDPDMDAAQGKRVEIIENLHRGELTKAEREQHVAELLKLDPAKSDRRVEKETGVNRNKVKKIREQLEDAGDVSQNDTRTDSKGRQQRAHKSASVVRKEDSPAAAPAAEEAKLSLKGFYEFLGGEPGTDDPLDAIMGLIEALPDGHLERFTRYLLPHLVERFDKGSKQWIGHDRYTSRSATWLDFKDALGRFAKRLDRDWFFTPAVMAEQPAERDSIPEPVAQPEPTPLEQAIAAAAEPVQTTEAPPATTPAPEPEPATVAPPAATAGDPMTCQKPSGVCGYLGCGKAGRCLWRPGGIAPAMTVQHGRNKGQFAPVPTTEARPE
jgi:hypothetical protein